VPHAGLALRVPTERFPLSESCSASRRGLCAPSYEPRARQHRVPRRLWNFLRPAALSYAAGQPSLRRIGHPADRSLLPFVLPVLSTAVPARQPVNERVST